MRVKKLGLQSFIWATALVGVSQSAFAAGYEKSLLWSGRYTGIGGAAASSVLGPESLFFNPAGLAGSELLQISLNIAPTFAQFSAPLVPGGSAISSSLAFLPVGSALVSYELIPHLTLGLGAFISAGSQSTYSNVDFTSLNAGFSQLKPTIGASLTVAEYSLGAAYEIINGLKAGIAYRIVSTSGQFSSVIASSTSLTSLTLGGLSTTNFNGFRAGLQYNPKGSPFGIGVNYRSEIQFNATGTSSGQILIPSASATPQALTGGAVTVTNYLPQALEIGAHYQILPETLQVFAQYAITQYNRNAFLGITGNASLPAALGGTTMAIANTTENWGNLNTYRLGLQYEGVKDWALRAGFIYNSQVTPAANALGVFAPPGNGQTYVIGAGTRMVPHLMLNAALEYTVEAGTVAASDQPNFGNYGLNVYALHVGGTYEF